MACLLRWLEHGSVKLVLDKCIIPVSIKHPSEIGKKKGKLVNTLMLLLQEGPGEEVGNLEWIR